MATLIIQKGYAKEVLTFQMWSYLRAFIWDIICRILWAIYNNICLWVKPITIYVYGLNLLENSGLVSLLLVVTELDLDLKSRELSGVVEPDGVGPVQNGLPGLLVQQVELDGVPGVDVCVAVKVLPLQQQDVGFNDALFSQRLAVVDPVDWKSGKNGSENGGHNGETCSKNVRKMFEKCLKNVRKMFEKCSKNVRKCLQCQKMILKNVRKLPQKSQKMIEKRKIKKMSKNDRKCLKS